MKILKQSEYFGSQRWELAQKGISLSEYDYLEKGTPWHYHENPYFMYVLKGEMVDVNKAHKSNLASGSLMFLNWQEPHCTQKYSSSARGFHLQLDRQWLIHNGLNTELWEGSRLLETPSIHLLLSKIYYEFRQQDEFSVFAIELLVTQLCDTLSEQNSTSAKSPPPWIDQLKEILHSHPNKLTLSDLSQQLGVHPVHISRSIPLFFDTTLGEYIRSLKIKQALPLLLNQSLSLSQIAYTCGFADQSHFTRTFKSYFNQTPKAFRSKC